MISKLNEEGLRAAAQAWDTDKSDTIIDGLKAAIEAYLPHHDAWLPIPKDAEIAELRGLLGNGEAAIGMAVDVLTSALGCICHARFAKEPQIDEMDEEIKLIKKAIALLNAAKLTAALAKKE